MLLDHLVFAPALIPVVWLISYIFWGIPSFFYLDSDDPKLRLWGLVKDALDRWEVSGDRGRLLVREREYWDYSGVEVCWGDEAITRDLPRWLYLRAIRLYRRDLKAQERAKDRNRIERVIKNARP